MSRLHSSSVLQSADALLKDLKVPPASSIVVGLSGGMDSMTLLNVLQTLSFTVSAAHVNFSLRGIESDEDALFVKNYCQQSGIPFLEKKFDTKSYIEQTGTNIQSAARKLRYQWWEEIMQSGSFDFLATAHHHDDNVETLLMNLLRGSGLKGLKGIPEKRDYILRPLLHVTRKDIEEYARVNQIPFRSDSSNEKDDYLRNRIRHHIVPMLKEVAGEGDDLFTSTLQRLNEEWRAWEYQFTEWTMHNTRQEGLDIHLDVKDHQYPFLLKWLEEKGVPWKLAHDFVTSSVADKGKSLNYPPFRLYRSNEGFVLQTERDEASVRIESPETIDIGDHRLIIEKIALTSIDKTTDPYTEYIDADVITWPLTLRVWQPGDIFQPIGMQGRSKKIQDLLVDNKISIAEKNRLRVLTSSDQIIWVVGIRLDERVKISELTTNVLKLSFQRH
jgi:tRNA(Ile)-lysidine synthase